MPMAFGDGPQSADTPLALIGPLQRAISPATNLAKYSGLLRSGGAISSPSASKRSRTDGVSSAAPTASLRRRTIGSGVPLGKNRPCQVLTSKSRPCSRAVGTFGRTDGRRDPVLAMALIELLSICGSDVDTESHT